MTALHAVDGGEPTPRKRGSRAPVSKAAKAGDRRELLVALQARIARAVDDPKTPPRDLSSLGRRLLEVNRELAELDTRTAQEHAEPDSDDEWDDEAI